MNENNFKTLYKTLTTDQLLEIVENPSEYQPLAIETARLEIESRQLTEEQLAAAKAEQDIRQQDKANKQQKVKDFEDKFKSVGSSLADTFNPIQKEAPTTDKFIKLILLFIGVLFLYQLYKDFGFLKFMFTGGVGRWDFSTVFYFLPFIILPTTGLLFWFRRKIGWTLATVYFTYTAAGVIPMFIMEINRRPTGMPALDGIFPTTSPVVYIGTQLVFGGLTWTLCKPNMREVYHVDQKSMFTALGIGIGIILLMVISFGI